MLICDRVHPANVLPFAKWLAFISGVDVARPPQEARVRYSTTLFRKNIDKSFKSFEGGTDMIRCAWAAATFFHPPPGQ